MGKIFAGGHLRYLHGAWRDDNGDVAEIAQVKHGRWIDNAIALAEKCSVCGEAVYWDDGNYHRYPHCPNCGAKME